MQTSGHERRMLRGTDVVKRTGLSRTTIWRLERDGDFPKRVTISRGCVAWPSDEVDAWIDDRIDAERDRKAA